MIKNYETQLASILRNLGDTVTPGEGTGDGFDLSTMSMAMVLILLAVLYFFVSAKRNSAARVEKPTS